MTLNYVFTAVVWVGLLIVWLIVDLPDLHVAALTIASIAVAVFTPLLFWPVSKTLWSSADYLIYRTSPDYGSREAADRFERQRRTDLLSYSRQGSRTPRSAATASASS